jgi:hypothetical protein
VTTSGDKVQLGSPSRAAPWIPQIYFARAIDGMDEVANVSLGTTVARELAEHEMKIVDPFVEARKRKLVRSRSEDHSRLLVEFDLGLLRRCDGVLMDMSIPTRAYVGCVCELTYAFLWRIPVVVYVGESSNGERHWLKYHASKIHQGRRDAIMALADLVRGEARRLEWQI